MIFYKFIDKDINVYTFVMGFQDEKTHFRQPHLNHIASIFEPQNISIDFHSSFPISNPQSEMPNPQSEMPNPQSEIPNSQSEIPNPQSEIPI